MIPKQLFFIWIGREIPDYVNFSINTFKNINPDFKVDLITDNNSEAKFCIDYFFHKNIIDINLKTYFDRQLSYPFEKKYAQKYPYITISHLLRNYLIYKYGGIYIDCDTFPVKPFDNELLQQECFSIEYDNFMFGAVKDKLFNNSGVRSFFNSKTYHLKNYTIDKPCIYSRNYMNPRYEKLYSKFVDKKIIYGESVLDSNLKDYYIDHYFQHTYLGHKFIS